MHSHFKRGALVAIGVLLVVVFIVVLQHKPRSDDEFTIDNVEQIKLENLYVRPLPSNKDPVPDFSKYANVTEKKKAFFAYLLPEIRRQNFIVLKERKMVLALYELVSDKQTLTANQKKVLSHLIKKYKLAKKKDMTNEYLLSQLIKRVDEIPAALILVQAANESGWGTSRFARDGYNFFGLWCFKKGCGFVPSRREEGSGHEVAKFKDLSHAVMTYIRNLNRLYAYHELREIRVNLRRQGKLVTSEALAQGLSKYSERGQEYIDELLNMIRVNRKYMGLAK
ncbi:glucosaminidase domain-containing protein [Paraglaciecola aquimarina]|uniref:Glucosaminidase domain-containing protein n=1 Tax=Paraglaciecola aquimarina TaxID=1235557 RepID=A0ABU3SYK7_9ALTE|nr:glucosaminidase domain-containing protein [Paraglaciecola aquimarina]MDU0355085.1 glucosaminidase domain-containing protein [Paraglaciecola aquimarina]